MPDLRVLIVGKNRLARVGLGAMLAQQPGIVVVADLPGDPSAEIDAHKPDVVLWDLDWEIDAEALSAIGRAGTPTLALLPDAGLAADAWAAGAAGLLLHDAEPEAIAAALNALACGLAALDRSLSSVMLPPRLPAPDEELTAREREVLHWMAEGLPNKAIAARLGISEHTVKFHVNAILNKLGVQSRTEAVVRAVRLGLLLL